MKKTEIKNLLIENGYKFEEVTVKKNGIPTEGLRFKAGKVEPTIYFKDIENMSDQELLYMLNDVMGNLPETSSLIENLSNIDFVRENAFLCLQKEYEEDLVMFPYEDLYIYIRIKADSKDGNIGSLKVSKSLLKAMNISKDTLRVYAERNTFASTEITPMWEILAEVLPVPPMFEDADCLMYVIRANNGLYGASGILNRKKIKEFLEEKNVKSAIIIPSSIHECIIWIGDQLNDINEMIQDVNETQVSEYEQLSDHSYRFDC